MALTIKNNLIFRRAMLTSIKDFNIKIMNEQVINHILHISSFKKNDIFYN